eukprot:CAMPEP_0171242158 /NCGR_PEP_ID=MMETSP0790-20130122/45519_1 /TAXON_ID=2925 /ORGANISM="Alexandrium catenella, Strain OF101" /LENGTH=258 /DNA_ID=CAMNT_0011708895 /DNA_START=60 /DNA_END=832 /DNA_ORIENTATION=-
MTTLPAIRKGCEQGGLQGGQDALLRRLQLCWQQAEEAEAASSAKRPKTEPQPGGTSGDPPRDDDTLKDGQPLRERAAEGSRKAPGADGDASEEEFQDDDAVDSDAETIGRKLKAADMALFDTAAATTLLQALGTTWSVLGPDDEPQPLRVYERIAFVRDLRYTRDRLPARFDDGRPLQELLGELRSSRVVASSAPFLVLNVVHFKGRLFCLDNRRLWCLRQFQTQASHEVRVRVRAHELGPVARKFLARQPGGPPRIL